MTSPPPDGPSSSTESNLPVSHPTPGIQMIVDHAIPPPRVFKTVDTLLERDGAQIFLRRMFRFFFFLFFFLLFFWGGKVREVDRDGSGEIGFNEFLAILQPNRKDAVKGTIAKVIALQEVKKVGACCCCCCFCCCCCCCHKHKTQCRCGHTSIEGGEAPFLVLPNKREKKVKMTGGHFLTQYRPNFVLFFMQQFAWTPTCSSPKGIVHQRHTWTYFFAQNPPLPRKGYYRAPQKLVYLHPTMDQTFGRGGGVTFGVYLFLAIWIRTSEMVYRHSCAAPKVTPQKHFREGVAK